MSDRSCLNCAVAADAAAADEDDSPCCEGYWHYMLFSHLISVVIVPRFQFRFRFLPVSLAVVVVAAPGSFQYCPEMTSVYQLLPTCSFALL